mmetsp:Transcript_24933/g.50087  ORF Transcript_24933/g.50087 Transcript_24933/m.50087 type:complete len:252 (-) Transcript_24933:2201-2956(-)
MGRLARALRPHQVRGGARDGACAAGLGADGQLSWPKGRAAGAHGGPHKASGTLHRLRQGVTAPRAAARNAHALYRDVEGDGPVARPWLPRVGEADLRFAAAHLRAGLGDLFLVRQGSRRRLQRLEQPARRDDAGERVGVARARHWPVDRGIPDCAHQHALRAGGQRKRPADPARLRHIARPRRRPPCKPDVRQQWVGRALLPLARLPCDVAQQARAQGRQEGEAGGLQGQAQRARLEQTLQDEPRRSQEGV